MKVYSKIICFFVQLSETIKGGKSTDHQRAIEYGHTSQSDHASGGRVQQREHQTLFQWGCDHTVSIKKYQIETDDI